MARPDQLPLPPGPARHRPADGPPGARRGVPAAVIAVAAVIAGTAVLGVAAGFLWAAVAPRALVVVIGRGSADVVNPETNAFIAADGWFTLLTVIGGLVSGAAAYVLAVRRNGAPAMAGVLAGGLAAALIAKWIGEQSGVSGFNHSLAVGHVGALVRDPLALGGVGALMFWPIAAGVVAGGIELITMAAERGRGWQPALAAARGPGGGQVPGGGPIPGAPPPAVPDGPGGPGGPGGGAPG
jgi:hypothetical protein